MSGCVRLLLLPGFREVLRIFITDASVRHSFMRLRAFYPARRGGLEAYRFPCRSVKEHAVLVGLEPMHVSTRTALRTCHWHRSRGGPCTIRRSNNFFLHFHNRRTDHTVSGLWPPAALANADFPWMHLDVFSQSWCAYEARLVHEWMLCLSHLDIHSVRLTIETQTSSNTQ